MKITLNFLLSYSPMDDIDMRDFVLPIFFKIAYFQLLGAYYLPIFCLIAIPFAY